MTPAGLQCLSREELTYLRCWVEPESLTGVKSEGVLHPLPVALVEASTSSALLDASSFSMPLSEAPLANIATDRVQRSISRGGLTR